MSQSLIPDIKPLAGQEAVVDLHADDSRISEDETERNGDDGTHDKGLKICRTVTQVRLLHPRVGGGAVDAEQTTEELRWSPKGELFPSVPTVRIIGPFGGMWTTKSNLLPVIKFY